VIQIAVVNQSTVLTDDQVCPMVAAIQKQVSGDFAAAWGLDAALTFYPRDAAVPAHDWQAVMLDDSDQADALGYHDLTASGQPLAKIFAKSDQQDGCQPSITLSHEILEMIADPWINACVLSPDGRKLYIREVCDAPEADEFGYAIDGVSVSDFVTPAFFEAPTDPVQAFDREGKVIAPFTLLPGGYLSFIDLADPAKGWQQVTADKHGHHRNAGPHYKAKSRFQRLRRARVNWKKSER
jgi:hypothetical protein